MPWILLPFRPRCNVASPFFRNLVGLKNNFLAFQTYLRHMFIGVLFRIFMVRRVMSYLGYVPIFFPGGTVFLPDIVLAHCLKHFLCIGTFHTQEDGKERQASGKFRVSQMAHKISYRNFMMGPPRFSSINLPISPLVCI